MKCLRQLQFERLCFLQNVLEQSQAPTSTGQGRKAPGSSRLQLVFWVCGMSVPQLSLANVLPSMAAVRRKCTPSHSSRSSFSSFAFLLTCHTCSLSPTMCFGDLLICHVLSTCQDAINTSSPSTVANTDCSFRTSFMLRADSSISWASNIVAASLHNGRMLCSTNGKLHKTATNGA